MDNKTNNLKLRELILFCQLVSFAHESKLPFAKALLISAETSDLIKPAQWCKKIARRLEAGHSISEAVKELKDFDPILAGLLPLLGDNKLMLIFQSYTKFLTSLDIIKSKLRIALFYPLIIQVLLILNLIILNIKFFPEFYPVLLEQSRGIPIIMKLLYFLNPSLWPLSILLPLLICYIFLALIKLLYLANWNTYFASWLIKFLGIQKTLKSLMEARLQAVIALYISAGNSIEFAIEKAIESEPQGANALNLHRVKHLLENGLSANIAFEESDMLEYFAQESGEIANNLSENLLHASDSNFRTAEKTLTMYENITGVIVLVLAGFFVLLVTTGFFSPYFLAVSGVNQ